MFKFCNENGNRILKSSYIDDVEAFFTTRDFDIESYSEFKTKEGYRIIRPEQTHSDNVELVDDRIEYKETDGLIVSDRNTIICLKFADCTPLIFYDSVKKVGAVSHAGWRGTAAKIGVKTVQKMQEVYECNLYDIKVLIGPAIGICCYEVSDEVKNECLKTINSRQNMFEQNRIDLKQINAQQLKEIGIINIDICKYCTSCNNDLFYSYRKENGTLNRHYAILSI